MGTGGPAAGAASGPPDGLVRMNLDVKDETPVTAQPAHPPTTPGLVDAACTSFSWRIKATWTHDFLDLIHYKNLMTITLSFVKTR